MARNKQNEKHLFNSWLIPVFAGCFLVGCIFWFSTNSDSESLEDDGATKVSTQPKKASKTTSAEKDKGKPARHEGRKSQSAQKTVDQRTQDEKQAAADRARRIAEEQRRQQEEWKISDSNRLAKSEAILAAQAPRKYFDNEVENTLEVVSKPGAQFLILPQVTLSQEKVLEYLKKPVEVAENDDAETIAAKERTALFKEKAIAYLENGGTINQFIREQAAAAADEREAIDEIRREKDRILIAEGPEAAQAYLDKINPELKKMKLPEIKMGRADVSRLRHQQRKQQQTNGKQK